MKFDPENPFPLAPAGVSYAEEKAHSGLVDNWLGLRIEEVESRLVDPKDGAKRWIGQGAAVFQTPYSEIRRMLSLVKPVGLVVDLGAAYGRLGFVLAHHFPGTSFLGFELVEQRAAEGNRIMRRHRLTAAKIEVADISLPDFKLPLADSYFIYDFGSRSSVAKVLLDLQQAASKRTVVLVGRGREVRDQVEREHPWLTVVAPDHQGNFSIYRSALP